MKNSDGEQDAVLTMTFAAFVIVAVKFILSGVTVGSFSFGEVGSDDIAAMLAPTLGAYVGRKYTDMKFASSADAEDPAPEDHGG